MTCKEKTPSHSDRIIKEQRVYYGDALYKAIQDISGYQEELEQNCLDENHNT